MALAGHNRGVNNHFGKIHTLDTGNTITLTTALGTRTYTVTSVAKVDVMDNTMLEATSDNCIILAVALALGGPFIQDGHHAGVGFGTDGPPEALFQLDLHLRHHHRQNEQPKGGMILPLFFLQSVRDGEGQAWDD